MKRRMSYKTEQTIWVIVVALIFVLAIGMVCWRGAQAAEIVEEIRQICRQPYRDLQSGECVWPDNGYPWAMVNAYDVCARKGPGLNHAVMYTVSYGCCVEVIAEKNGWVQCYYWVSPETPVWIWGEYLNGV